MSLALRGEALDIQASKPIFVGTGAALKEARLKLSYELQGLSVAGRALAQNARVDSRTDLAGIKPGRQSLTLALVEGNPGTGVFG